MFRNLCGNRAGMLFSWALLTKLSPGYHPAWKALLGPPPFKNEPLSEPWEAFWT